MNGREIGRRIWSALADKLASGPSALVARFSPAVPEAMAGRVRMEQVQAILRLTPVMMG